MAHELTKFLSILQDFVFFWGRCPATIQKTQGKGIAHLMIPIGDWFFIQERPEPEPEPGEEIQIGSNIISQVGREIAPNFGLDLSFTQHMLPLTGLVCLFFCSAQFYHSLILGLKITPNFGLDAAYVALVCRFCSI